jgi:kynureninase
MESQVRLHGHQPDESIIEVIPREGEHTLRTEDIIKTIHEHKNELALVLFGGINYYSGQLFDLRAITEATHQCGAYAGFDLAHAAGNVQLLLHDWNVDFACWCSYKYLNSGPGGVAGAYIHEKHASNPDLPRLAGWWGYTKETRFKMEKGFDAIPTAEGWQVSNTAVLAMAAHKAALDIFDEAGMEALAEKRGILTGYLLFILDELNKQKEQPPIQVITPRNTAERGSQLSMLIMQNGKNIFDALLKQGVITDWREPNVIRVAPVPLYNTFEDVWHFGNLLQHLL